MCTRRLSHDKMGGGLRENVLPNSGVRKTIIILIKLNFLAIIRWLRLHRVN